jgi:hypothetical protein
LTKTLQIAILNPKEVLMDTNNTTDKPSYPLHHEDPIIHPVGANIAKKDYKPDEPLANKESTDNA